MSHHELWRDEVQAWLLARESTSALDLLSRQKYEGHPALWQLLLLPLTRIFGTPVAMQALHLLIATTTVYLFVRWSPFTRLQKILFSFGYFPFYEYAIISRSYGLSLLLLTVFCCLYPRRHRHFIPIAFTLVLLCHTHALSLIMVLVLFAALCLERLIPQASPDQPRCAPVPFYAGCALIGLGIVTAVIQIRPPADTGIAVGWQFGFSYDALRGAAKALVGAYVPIPRVGLNYWNNPAGVENQHFLLNLPCYLVATTYVLFVLAGLRRNLPVFLVFASGTAGLLAFYYAKYPGSTRHHGFLFACLIVSAWMHRSGSAATESRPDAIGGTRWARAFSLSLTLLFGVHVAAAGIAAGLECRYPFSAARTVTDYLHHHGHDESLLVGHIDYTSSALLGTSAQRQIYYPQSRRWGSYIIWNRARLTEPTDQEMIDEARALPRRTGQHVLLVLDRRLDDRVVQKNRISTLGHFTGAVVYDENFHLYQLD